MPSSLQEDFPFIAPDLHTHTQKRETIFLMCHNSLSKKDLRTCLPYHTPDKGGSRILTAILQVNGF